VLKEPQQVMKLTVNITHQLQGRLKFEKRRLVGDDRDGCVDEKRHLIRRQRHVRAGFLCGWSERAIGRG
jgi:hypothetical protein